MHSSSLEYMSNDYFFTKRTYIQSVIFHWIINHFCLINVFLDKIVNETATDVVVFAGSV